MFKLGPAAAGSFSIVVCAAAIGCHADSHRVQYPDHALSLESLDGWTESRERGALVFWDPVSLATIEIRTGDILPGGGNLDDLAVIARRELDGLASASVAPAVSLDHPAMTGALFRFWFRRPDRIGWYGGRRAVLLGGRHFYHITLTVPALELSSVTELFFQTVSSLREQEGS